MNRRRFIYSTVGIAAALGVSIFNRILHHTTASKTDTQETINNSSSDTSHSVSGVFSDHQFKMIVLLLSLIIPSEDGYGAREANLSAYIENEVSLDTRKRKIYKKGLLDLDESCLDDYGRNFISLTYTEQYDLLDRIFSNYEERRQKANGFFARSKRKISLLWDSQFGVGRHTRFFALLRRDAMEGFYSHPLGWKLTGYHGPPQPLGYPNYSEAPTIIEKKQVSSTKIHG